MKFISETRQQTIDAMKHERVATDGQFKAIVVGVGAATLGLVTMLGIETYQEIQDSQENPCEMNSQFYDASDC